MMGPSKQLMKTHRANLVHDCVDVIEFYDQNVFDKHRLMQRLSVDVLRSLIYKTEVFLNYIENFISRKRKVSRNNE